MLRFKRFTILLCVIFILGSAAFPVIAQEEDRAYFIGQHHVDSWPVWIGVFWEVQSFRTTFGNVAEENEVFRANPFSNYITVFESYPSVADAMGWAESPDLRDGMARGTADSPPRVYLNALTESQNPASGNALVLIEQVLSTYEGWYAAFGQMQPALAEAGGTGYRIFRDAQFPNHVTLALEFDTLANAQAFQASGPYTAFIGNDTYVAPPIVLLLEPFRE
jgi:hypothetical protein